MAKKNIHKSKRSGEQPCEICKDKIPLERHHLRGREVPNPHKDWNTAYICPVCHTKAHTGQIIIEGWFNTTSGRELIWHEKGEESITGQECVVHIKV